MYIGALSVTRLSAFLDGYRSAVCEFKDSFDDRSPLSFHDWAAMKLGHYESTSGWCNMLLETEKGDEEKAFAHFFELLDEYKNRRARIIQEAVPESGRPWRYRVVDIETDERVEIEYPSLVQIITYDDTRNGVFIRYLNKNGELIEREEYCSEMYLAISHTENFIDKDRWTFPE